MVQLSEVPMSLFPCLEDTWEGEFCLLLPGARNCTKTDTPSAGVLQGAWQLSLTIVTCLPC